MPGQCNTQVWHALGVTIDPGRLTIPCPNCGQPASTHTQVSKEAVPADVMFLVNPDAVRSWPVKP